MELAPTPASPRQPGLWASLYLEPQLRPQEVAVSLCCAVSLLDLVITWGNGSVGGLSNISRWGHTGRLWVHDYDWLVRWGGVKVQPHDT